MGIFDKAKDLAKGHMEQVDQGLEKLDDVLDDKLGHKCDGLTDKAKDLIKDQLNK